MNLKLTRWLLLWLFAGAGMSAPAQTFRHIVYSGNQTLILSQADTENMTLEGPKKDQAGVGFEVKEDILYISDKPGFVFKSPVSIRVSYRHLDSLALSGQARALNDISIRHPLAIALSGQSEANLELEAPERPFRAYLSGKALLKLSGTAQSLHVSLKAEALLRAADLTCARGYVNHAGTADAQVHCTEFLKATLTGNGVLYYRGNPHLQQEVTGSGQVRREE
ncbi:MAG: DUF2807 domain-containing protein [Bacteroidetes bacterium]|nr:DUF2807 domain-containing protein [Bacteroidota bacterium]